MIPRIEQKFELIPVNYPLFIEWLYQKGYQTLYPNRVVTSVYFDNSNYASYNETIEGLTPRRKIRIRGYGSIDPFSSGNNFSLEKKLSGSFQRSKSQEKINRNQFLDFCKNGLLDSQYGLCNPTVVVSYTREYYTLDHVRITIDKDISYRSCSLQPLQEVLDDNFVFEVKTSINTNLLNLSNHLAFPLTRFSKYERAIEFLGIQ